MKSKNTKKENKKKDEAGDQTRQTKLNQMCKSGCESGGLSWEEQVVRPSDINKA